MAFIYYVTQIQFDFGAIKLLKQECDRVGITQEQCRNTAWNGRQGQPEQHPLIVGQRDAGTPCESRAAEPQPVVAKIDQHREQGAEVQAKIEDQSLIAPAQPLANQEQMRRRRDRQELGQRLDQRQYQDPQKVQGAFGPMG